MSSMKYSKSDEWVKVEGNKAYVGITDYAQKSLGDIVFIELPVRGENLNAGGSIGVVESVKAAADIYTPISGTVVDVNEELEDSPEKLNEAPYENWIVMLELSNPEELEGLMSKDEYEKLCLEEG